MTQLYTSSRLRVLRDCLRRHQYQYVLGIRTPATDAMAFGTVAHAALEAYFRAWMDGSDRISPALAAIAASPLTDWERARLRLLVAAYHARWGHEQWEILAVEEEFRYQLNGRTVGGKIDALIRDTRGVWVLEHKTTRQDASPGSPYWERLSIDSQVSAYIDGAAMLGHQIAGCIYDVLHKPGHEPRMATPEAEREYTKGTGCKGCGGSGGGKLGIVQGRGFYTVAGPGEEPKQITCEQCGGTGWKLDKDGKPDAPRLYARQRETDETVAEFEERVLVEIATAPDDYLIRGAVVRLDDELPRMRLDLLDSIALAEWSAKEFGDAPPRNPDACNKFGSLCPFFAACSGRASIDDEHQFPRGRLHPELAA